jgi:glutamate synthase domain-containing protein 2
LWKFYVSCRDSGSPANSCRLKYLKKINQNILRTRLEYQIEGRLRCSAEVVKAAGGDYFSKPLFSGLRAQSQSYLL